MPQSSFFELAQDFLPFFEGEDRILAAYMLGSAVSGRMRPDSDVDVAILMYADRRLDDLERATLAGKIAFAVGREVDLGELGSRNLIYAKEAILTGRRIFARNIQDADQAETTLLAMYVRFNEDRQEVLDAYRA